jgi:pyruvate dehydrogenase E1 component beta subunit
LPGFGPERIRDTPLSESAFVGAGIGAAMGGVRPIVEIMTVNFSLLALDQIVNNAATILHMSVGNSHTAGDRMATGAGRQRRSLHSLEGWYAHIPGIKVLAPATLEDARGMLWTALEDPDPVLISSYRRSTTWKDLPSRRPPSSEHAAVRRAETSGDRHHGATLFKASGSSRTSDSIDRVVDPDLAPRHGHHRTSVKTRARRCREGWRSGGLSAEIAARLSEEAFYELEAPIARVCTAEVPIPYPKHLEMPRCPGGDHRDAARALIH